MKEYYECHVTMEGDPITLKPLVEREGWKFSAINGDPVLGAGLKCYATMFYPNNKLTSWIFEELHGVANALESNGAKILRRKVELVIYDDKIGKIVCDGSCCQLNGG